MSFVILIVPKYGSGRMTVTNLRLPFTDLRSTILTVVPDTTHIRFLGELDLDTSNRKLTSDIELNQRLLCVFLFCVRDHILSGWWLLFIQTLFDSVGCNTKISPEGEETRRLCPQCHNGQTFWSELKYTQLINADRWQCRFSPQKALPGLNYFGYHSFRYRGNIFGCVVSANGVKMWSKSTYFHELSPSNKPDVALTQLNSQAPGGSQ